MTIQEFKNKLKNNPEAIDFTETMAVIEANYNFTPTTFTNGNVVNEAGQNSGSCKLFAFAVTEKLSKEETLASFGQYYFEDVLKNPGGESHQNIRNFMQSGFKGLKFEREALTKK